METPTLAALATYAFVMSVTPGPNNLMLTASGLLFGVARTVPHMLGILAGVAVQIGAVGAGLGAVFAAEPRLQLGLKAFGTAYLLWLARGLWRAGEGGASGDQGPPAGRPIAWWQAALFQGVNPKAWLSAVTVVAAFVPAGSGPGRLATVIGVFCAVGLPCMWLWAAFGSMLKARLREPRTVRTVNRVMAALAAATAGLFWV